MAARCELRLPTKPDSRDAALAAIAEICRIEAKYSRYRNDSVIANINQNASDGEVFCDHETLSLLRFADDMYRLSGGLFDITSGVLRKAWNFKAGSVAAQAQLNQLLPLVGWKYVDIRHQTISFQRDGMELDFGGIGKEYAADRGRQVLIDKGVSCALIDLGGDIASLGGKPDGSPWTLGIRHPRQNDQILAVVPIQTGALATSGDYERFIVHQGIRYCHILNPQTGWPCTYWQSMSIIESSCLRAGALATIAMLKQQSAPEFLEQQRISWLGVGPDGAVLMV